MLSMKLKLSILMAGAMVLVMVLTGVYVRHSQSRMIDTMIQDRLEASIGSVKALLKEKSEQALAIASTAANIPAVHDAAISLNRPEAINQLKPVFDALHDDFGLTVLHLRVPTDTSFVRAQKPEEYGDVTKRQAILDTAKNVSPISGFDKAAFGMGMRGWVPVIVEGRVIGTMEANIEFSEDLLHDIAATTGVELALWVPNENTFDLQSKTDDTIQSVEPDTIMQAVGGMTRVAYQGTPHMRSFQSTVMKGSY